MKLLLPWKRFRKQRVHRAEASAKLLMALAPVVMVGCGLEKPMRVDNRSLPEKYVNGSFMVELDGTDEEQAANLAKVRETNKALASEYGCDVTEPAKIRWENQSGVLPASLNQTYHVQFKNCELDRAYTQDVIDTLAGVEAVASVTADAVAEATAVTENDPDKGKQYYLSHVHRDEACEIASGGQKPVVVAVIDSGVDKNHPDLQAAFYRDGNGKILGANFVGKGSNDQPDDLWDDGNGHGTHVAGIIAASANNSEGIAGVAGCANVKVMPIRALDDNGSGSTLEIERAVMWAAENGADIINLSLGSKRVSETKQPVMKRPLYDALAERNIAVFAAAGNDGLVNGSRSEKGYVYATPASYENVIAVASTDESEGLSSFSNRGDRIDIAAPGSNIFATYPKSAYKSLSGTSMATPVAAGVYAMALSTVKDRIGHVAVSELQEILQATVTEADTLDKRMVASGGIMDALKVVETVKVKYGKAAPREPVNSPRADVPAVGGTTSKVAELGFANLSPSQSLHDAVAISVSGLPAGARFVYLYWGLPGKTLRSFTRIAVVNGEAHVSTEDAYYLLGNGRLYAEAVDANFDRIGLGAIGLQGL